MVDEGLCLDGPYEEDVEPVLGFSVDEIRNMSMEQYAQAREELLRGASQLRYNNPGVFISK